MNTHISLAALVLVAGVAAAAAQTAPGGSAGSGGTSPMPRALSSSPDTGAAGTASETAPAVPQPSENPNAQVPPSAASLPGGGDVPITSSPDAETAVPVYGTKEASTPLTEAEERSRSDACGGQGTRTASGTGTTSAQGTGENCADTSLGTSPIMGSSGTIDVRETGR